MNQLSLSHNLDLKHPAVVALCGAGGKTSLLQRLAAETNAAGNKALITTTTKISIPQNVPLFTLAQTGNSIKTLTKALKEHFNKHSLAVLGGKIIPGGKIEGIEGALTGLLRDELSVSVLVEADGSRGLPIKGYAAYEPALPSCSNYIGAVIGADSVGLAVTTKSVHRPELFRQITGTKIGETITTEAISSVFKHMMYLGHKQAPEARAFYLLNKQDLLSDAGLVALEVADYLRENNTTDVDDVNRLLITSAHDPNPVKISLNLSSRAPVISVACIVLAAGKSSRMGQDKLVLPIEGKPMLEQVLSQALQTDFAEVVAVKRPQFRVAESVECERLTVVENHTVQGDMASSLQTGLRALKSEHQGAVFALADQPAVDKELFTMLINHYRRSLKPATVPLYRGHRGNPVLFDRRLWPELMMVRGDEGGRSVLNKLTDNQIDRIETGREAVVSDLDTPEDYRRYLNSLREKTGLTFLV